MPERVVQREVDDLIDEINEKLSRFKIDYHGLALRDKVKKLVEVEYDTRCLNVNVVREHGYSITAAKERLRQYLTNHVLVVIDGPELEVVSGISEYARRIRELRVEEGFRILTGQTSDPDFSDLSLRPDEYLLVDETPDTDAARRWHIANRIRRGDDVVKDKILKFLLENVGQVVTTEELSYIAGGKKEFARRVRELRTEEGYAVATKITGRPDLKVGEYILLDANRIAVAHDRHIPIEVQREVYERDDNKCRNCGWSIDLNTRRDSRILELHHLKHHAHGGVNTAINIIVLCSVCHDQVHAGALNIDQIRNG